MGLFEELNTAGLLAIGLIPEWVDQDATPAAYTGAPSSAASGVFLQDSPRALFHVAAREDVHRREARIKIDTFDLLSGVYAVVIDGNTVSIDAAVLLPATNADLVIALAAAIAADGATGPIVNSIVDPGDPDVVLLTGKAEADFSVDFSVTGGAGVMSATASASAFDVRLFTISGGIIKTGNKGNKGGWVKPLNAAYAGLDFRGVTERVDVAGLSRLYVQVENITGPGADGGSVVLTLARVMIGPTVLEATS